MNLTIIAGARPNFMKIAPIIRAIKTHNEKHSLRIGFRLVHTGQHYDTKLSKIFFDELQLPEPDVNLGAGSGTQAEQTARIMVEFEKDLLQHPADLVIVVGDVTSTMACTIVAKKLNTRVAHIEGGIRSFDMTMPEEINRIVTDSLADYFFTTSRVANENLRQTGIDPSRIFFVGNTMIDSLRFSLDKLTPPDIWHKLGLKKGRYMVLTLHRPSNVDDPLKLQQMLKVIEKGAGENYVIFPVHPRTRKNLDHISAKFDTIKPVDPLSYFQFVYLIQSAQAVITDSGGVQEETTVLGIPCITLRSNTERPETISEGTNALVGDDQDKLLMALRDIQAGSWKRGKTPELWDGHTAERIISTLARLGIKNDGN